MKIRQAKITDLEQIIPVFEDYDKASVGYLPAKYRSMRNKKKPAGKSIRTALLKDITQGDSAFLVAEEDGRILGYIFGEIRDDRHPLYDRPKTGELNDIAVLKRYQGQGIASKLWVELLKWFKKRKCEMVTLSVCSNNSAKNVYRKWGFELFYLRMIRKA